jgi:hypothetical protein
MEKLSLWKKEKKKKNITCICVLNFFFFLVFSINLTFPRKIQIFLNNFSILNFLKFSKINELRYQKMAILIF